MASQVDEVTLHDLIGRIYAAAVDPEEWPGFLSALSDALGSAGVVMRDFASIGANVQVDGKQFDAGQIDTESLELYCQLLPHIQRASELRRRLSQQLLVQSGALEALDSLAGGVMVLDGKGSVCYSNPAAEKLLERSQGLWLDQTGQVRATLKWQDEKLRRLIALAASGERNLENGGCLRVSRARGQPLALLMAPFQDEDAVWCETVTGVLVFIHDPDATPILFADAMRWHFGLTPAQARMAAALAAEGSVAECAEILNISVATARTHLKEIYAKTGARRQADLVRLLLSSHLYLARGNGVPRECRHGHRQTVPEAGPRAEEFA